MDVGKAKDMFILKNEYYKRKLNRLKQLVINY